MTTLHVRLMQPQDLERVVDLQREAFPPPFDPDLLWRPEHLEAHLHLFPRGQFVAERDGYIVGSCSNCLISEASWQRHGTWDRTVGGPYLDHHDPLGSTLYGLDISVHPDARRTGVGRAFYQGRFRLVRERTLARYGTACRMPDFREYAGRCPGTTSRAYAQLVAEGRTVDRTLTPLLRYGPQLIGVIENYMLDPESAHAAALLEWTP